MRYDAAIPWPGTATRLVEYRPLLRDGASELCGTITRRFRVFCVTRDTQFIAPPALARKVKQGSTTLVADRTRLLIVWEQRGIPKYCALAHHKTLQSRP